MSVSAKVNQPLAEVAADAAAVEQLYAELGALFDSELAAVRDGEDLKKLRDHWVGRKQGLLASSNEHWLKSAPRELKPAVGKLQNSLKTHIEQALEEQAARAAKAVRSEPGIDLTLPGPERPLGARHPVRIVQEEVESIFRSMGYSVSSGPEIESDYYNFEALNFPSDHPARDAMDTIFITDRMLLRTHHGKHAAAATLHRARQGLPQRRPRRQPLADVPPGGGLRGR
jgi:phenylalanyl-tRNA synthetase alpha chain